jgi:biotin-dependent carboxylase-like uncharacterized protein
MKMFRVLDPGPLTTVQDGGRLGFQEFGIPISGALDQFAYRVANLLVGNHEGAAVLEVTFIGPKLEALSDGIVAATGAGMPIFVNDRRQDAWQSFMVRPGDLITIKAARKGLRGYLAVGGGILVREVMGSRSTYLGGKMGGLNGRALARRDVLERGETALASRERLLPAEFVPRFDKEITLRALPGPQDDHFDAGLDLFFNSVFTVSSKCDRMGYRLEGPVIPFKEGVGTSIISEPSLPGVVQVPPDGRPIIILTEQTAGGYAKIATVLTPDLGLVAQARPGDLIRFAQTVIEEAHQAYIVYQEKLNRVRAVFQR